MKQMILALLRIGYWLDFLYVLGTIYWQRERLQQKIGADIHSLSRQEALAAKWLIKYQLLQPKIYESQEGKQPLSTVVNVFNHDGTITNAIARELEQQIHWAYKE